MKPTVTSPNGIRKNFFANSNGNEEVVKVVNGSHSELQNAPFIDG
jgi:hypothetical protein